MQNLGNADAERFVSLMQSEPFDYTKWRKTLNDKYSNVRELSKAATEYVRSADLVYVGEVI